MTEIISKLMGSYQQEEIIWHFQALVNREVEGELNLTPRIKTYFRMAKKRIPEVVPPSTVTKFTDKCKDLSEAQRADVFQLMKRRRIRWVEGEMILIVK
jgi:hypothetical protein